MSDEERKERLRRALDIAPIGTLHERIDTVEKRFQEQLGEMQRKINSLTVKESQTRGIIRLIGKKVDEK